MVHWAMAREKFFLCTVGDVTVLPKMLEAASRYKSKPSDKEMVAVLEQQTMEPLFVA